MGAQEFGQLVRRARIAKRPKMSQDRVAFLVGELPGGGENLTGKAVARIEEGGRRLDTFVVGRLIDVLGLDPIPAWHAAGLWPEGLEPEDVVNLSERRAARLEAARQAAAFEGARFAAPPFISDRPNSNKATLLASARQRVAA